MIYISYSKHARADI